MYPKGANPNLGNDMKPLFQGCQCSQRMSGYEGQDFLFFILLPVVLRFCLNVMGHNDMDYNLTAMETRSIAKTLVHFAHISSQR